jgi:hypothetical protein
LVGALEGTPETPWDLNTLNGVNAGGYGNKITATRDKCAGLEDDELIECNTKVSAKKFKKELADGTLVIDPLTGLTIPNPNPPEPEPEPEPKPEPKPEPEPEP